MDQKLDPTEFVAMRGALLHALDALPVVTDEHHKFYGTRLHFSWKKYTIVAGFIFLLTGLGAPIWYALDGSPPKFVQTIAGILPVPAVVVTKEISTTRTIQQRVVGLEHFYLRSSSTTSPSYGQLRSRVVKRVIRDLIIRNLAQSQNIAISQDELHIGFQEFATSQYELADLLRDIDLTYGWSQDEFENIVLRPLFLERKLVVFYKDEKALDDAVTAFSAQNKIRLWLRL